MTLRLCTTATLVQRAHPLFLAIGLARPRCLDRGQLLAHQLVQRGLELGQLSAALCQSVGVLVVPLPQTAKAGGHFLPWRPSFQTKHVSRFAACAAECSLEHMACRAKHIGGMVRQQQLWYALALFRHCILLCDTTHDTSRPSGGSSERMFRPLTV